MHPIRKTGLRRASTPRHGAWWRCVGLALAAKSLAAFGESRFAPYAAGSLEYESNPFYEWGGSRSGTATSSDTLRKLRGGVEAQLDWSRESLAFIVEARRIDYRVLTYLGHTEALFDGSLQSAFTSLVNSLVEYRRERRMVPFAELAPGTRELLLETEDWGAVSLTIQTLAGWRFETRGKLRKLASPRPGLPELDLRESSIHEGLRRTFGRLSVGLDAEYLRGWYRGAGEFGSPAYSDATAQLAAEHRITGLSSFEGAVGYTRRTESPGSRVSAVTGTVGYKRDLTGKTSLDVRLTRAVNSYVTTVGSEIDTACSFRATWQVTRKIQLAPSFTITYSQFPGSAGDGRRDRYEAAALDLRYQMFDWLSLHPYGRYDLRSSNVVGYGFNATAIGLELLLKEAR
jgi:Putative beta-barrel porin 2